MVAVRKAKGKEREERGGEEVADEGAEVSVGGGRERGEHAGCRVQAGGRADGRRMGRRAEQTGVGGLEGGRPPSMCGLVSASASAGKERRKSVTGTRTGRLGIRGIGPEDTERGAPGPDVSTTFRRR